MKSVLLPFTFFLLPFFLLSCATQTRPRGYVFPENAAELAAAAKTQADIERAFGSPGATSLHGGRYWIYYSMDENLRGPFPLKYDNRRALIVKMDDRGKVLFAKLLEEKDFPKTPKPSNDATPVPAAIELNMFQELINNIGRFTPGGV
ncbi:MAG: hypothetical protein FWD33_02085 [Alphaproteobacteria bacterium]|nr:hypothetical protein [Alphaproteobacteria bacterium]